MRLLLIVSDTSALSALAQMGWLDWLRERWQRVAVPEAVWLELASIGDDAGWESLLTAKNEGWLSIHTASDRSLVARLSRNLDGGESEAIALAVELHANALLIDEMDGREAAKKLGLETTGTLGIVIWAKRQGLVLSADQAVEALVRRTRFFISEAVREQVRRLAGEGG